MQTVDFFTPVVDDPYAFGAIAAANALSDVYAMGGQPLTALSIAAFPEKDFPWEWAAAIVRGGQETLSRAGCVLLGGHSVRDPEIKFGYAITGLVDPEAMFTNGRGRVGERLVLTKPLGTGIAATALKAGHLPPETLAAATTSMSQLNAAAAGSAQRAGVRGATDVTGFGLVGHAAAVARESRLTLEIGLDRLPLLPGILDLARRFAPGGLKANRLAYAGLVAGLAHDDPREPLVYDPQTSGGLLLLVPPDHLPQVLSENPGAREIGAARSPGPAPIVFL